MFTTLGLLGYRLKNAPAFAAYKNFRSQIGNYNPKDSDLKLEIQTLCPTGYSPNMHCDLPSKFGGKQCLMTIEHIEKDGATTVLRKIPTPSQCSVEGKLVDFNKVRLIEPNLEVYRLGPHANLFSVETIDRNYAAVLCHDGKAQYLSNTQTALFDFARKNIYGVNYAMWTCCVVVGLGLDLLFLKSISKKE